MLQLNLPKYDCRIRKNDDITDIFDPIRKTFLRLTPEEWVRQHIINFLVNHKGFPLSHIKVEYGLEVNGLKRRCDILAFDKNAAMILLVECKAPQVKISQNAFNQIANYNYALKVKYLFVTNGMEHFYASIDFKNEKYCFLKDLPNYKDL
jgi:hypothetical protein